MSRRGRSRRYGRRRTWGSLRTRSTRGYVKSRPQWVKGGPIVNFNNRNDPCYTKMIYSDNMLWALPDGGVCQKTYCTNTIYDPDGTLGGHQPFGHDFAQARYENYYVQKCKIVVTATAGGTQALPILIGTTMWGIGESQTLPTLPVLFEDSQRNKHKYRRLLPGMSQRVKKFVHTWTPFYNRNYGEQVVDTPFGANPSVKEYATLWARWGVPYAVAAPETGIAVNVKLIFYVRLSRPLPNTLQ